MNFSWLYDLPTWQFCTVTVGAFVCLTVCGLVISRPLVARWLGPPPASNEVVNSYLSAIGVFYGLTIGLVVVATWENFNEADDRVSHEAASIAALYRDLSGYPSPIRDELRDLLKQHVDYLIDHVWPAQRVGRPANDRMPRLLRFERILTSYEPVSEGQKILHEQAMREYSVLVELIRLRFNSIESGLPRILWIVLYAGAVLTIVPTFLLVLRHLALHIVLTAVLSALIGLLVFLIIALDQPFRGDTSIDPQPFIELRDTLQSPDFNDATADATGIESLKATADLAHENSHDGPQRLRPLQNRHRAVQLAHRRPHVGRPPVPRRATRET